MTPGLRLNELQILYQDRHVIVLSKPAGLLAQADHTGAPSVVSVLQKALGRPYVGLVHRLDRNVSGLMVVGQRTKAASRLSEALRKGEITRRYLGWVMGTLGEATTWTDHLVKDPKTNTVNIAQSGQLARTLVRPISHAQGRTLVEFSLETGRSHQIRVQSAHHGHPLWGDPKYGRASREIHRPALHSYYLKFNHPVEDSELEFVLGLPPELRS